MKDHKTAFGQELVTLAALNGLGQFLGPRTLFYHISQLTNLCKTLAAAILLTSSTHFGARLGAFFY